jgi:predicted metallopeptidase
VIDFKDLSSKEDKIKFAVWTVAKIPSKFNKSLRALTNYSGPSSVPFPNAGFAQIVNNLYSPVCKTELAIQN